MAIRPMLNIFSENMSKEDPDVLAKMREQQNMSTGQPQKEVRQVASQPRSTQPMTVQGGATTPTPTVNRPNLTLPSGQVISGQDPNYDVFKAQIDRAGKTTVIPQTLETPTPESVVERPILEETPYEKAQREYYEGLNRTVSDEQSIFDEERKRIQAQIDAINEIYAGQLASVQQQGKGLMAQTSAITTGAGLGASPFQQTAEAKTGAYNLQQENLVRQERAQKVAEVMGKADERAMARIQAEKSEVAQNQEQYLNYLAGLQDDARTDMSNMAQAGIDLKQLSSEEYNKLLKDTGYSKLQFDSYYNAMKPKAEQVKYEYQELKDGTLLRIGDDGSFEQIKDATPIPDGYKLTQLADGTLVQVNETTGDIKFIGEKGEFAKSGISEEAPTIKEINGVSQQWNPSTGKWEEPSGAGRNLVNEKEVENVENKIALIDKILANEAGIEGAVATYGWQRISPIAVDKAERLALAADVKNLIDTQTLQTLLDLKKAGGTLGAISEKELEILQSSATKIAGREIKDKNGNGTGRYEMSRDEFKNELNRIKESGKKIINAALKDKYNNLGITDVRFDEVVKKYNGDTEQIKQFIGELERLSAEYQQSSGFKNEAQTSLKGKISQKTNYLDNFGKITGYGSPYWDKGLDIDLKKGDPVPTPAAGTVIFAGKNGGFGNQVKIKTAKGNEIWLSHLDNIDVRVGDRVSKNEFIGLGGNTGSVIPVGGGDGSHLDLTVKKPGGTFYSPSEIHKMIA